MHVASRHEGVGAWEGQARQAFPFGVPGHAEPVPLPLRREVVHLLHAANHDHISATAGDRRPSIAQGEARGRACVLDATGWDAGHSGVLCKVGRRVPKLSAPERGGSEKDLVHRCGGKVTVNRRKT